MQYILTDNQKRLIQWIVNEVRNGTLTEEFTVIWVPAFIKGGGGIIESYKGDCPKISKGSLTALEEAKLIICTPIYTTLLVQTGSSSSSQQREKARTCTLTGNAFPAVDSNFNAPDTSFVEYITPLANVTNLDSELKSRCLPTLSAGSTDPRLWDSAFRTAVVILEERLRNVGQVSDHSRIGRDLVNDVFGKQGTLSSKFSIDAERQGYRDLFAGFVGVFRNRYAHRLIDPKPEDGGAFIVFVNLLLKMLEDLRKA